MARDGINPEARTTLARYLRQARAGKAEVRWLDTLVRAAGYAPVARGGDDRFLATAAEAARRFGVTRSTINRWVRAGMPVAHRSPGHHATLYDVLEVARWVAEQERVRREVDGEVMTLDGATSPWLEACRKEKALGLRRQNAVEDGRLVSRAKIGQEVEDIGRLLGEEFEVFRGTHGSEIAAELDAMLARAQAGWERVVAMPAGAEVPKARKRRAKSPKPRRQRRGHGEGD